MQEHLKTAALLYKPSREKIDLVLKIDELMGSKKWTGLRFDETFMIGDSRAVYLKRENTHCVILVYLDDMDHYCSAFALTLDELKSLYQIIYEKIGNLNKIPTILSPCR